jgi:aspartate aminotransferase-like enzyme
LPHRVLRLAWGEALGAERLQQALNEQRPAWLWAALCETSTGMDNGLALLREGAAGVGADLCLDAVSALGLQPLDLRGVWLASAVSGKALGAYAGLAIVLHDGRLAAPGQLPRSLDLAAFAVAGGVPYTQGSNGLAALEAALKIDWPARWQATREADAFLRAELAALGLPPLLSSAHAMPGVITLALPPGQNAARLGQRLERYGCKLAYQSAYLRERNWLQICLMGDWQRRAVEVLPQLLARRLRGLTETPEKVDAQ